jgi:hypothetical protein
MAYTFTEGKAVTHDVNPRQLSPTAARFAAFREAVGRRVQVSAKPPAQGR